MSRRALVTLALGFVCRAAAVHAQTPHSPSKSSADELVQADIAFARDSSEKGISGWLSWFAPDCAVFPQRGKITEGLAAIAELYARTGFTPEGLTWHPARAQIADSGDLGYTYGTWQLRRHDKSGKAVSGQGKYLTVWRRQKDGRWKVVADIGTEDAPEAGAPP
jgi:ketosteroid isomerase-like protein